jgi:dipeptidyl-peptidase-4
MRGFTGMVGAGLVVALAGFATTDLRVVAQSRGPAVAKKWLTYGQVFDAAGRMTPGETYRDPSGILTDLPAISGWLDDEHYLETRVDPADKRRKLFSVSVADGSAHVHRDATEADGLPRGFDLRTAAATSGDGRVFVFTRGEDLYAWNAPAKSWRRLTATAAPERFPRLSPDGRWLAYTRSNDLYAYDLEGGLERQLTSDGSDVIRNGDPSWVYMEEILGRGGNAFWWSPDSTRLVFMRFDDTPAPSFPIYHPDGQHGELEVQRYPKAGDANPWVKMGVVKVADGRTAWMDFEEKVDQYIAWPFWTPDSRTLTVQWMNRGQDTVRLFACDPDTGKKRLLLEEKQPAWVEWYKDLEFLPSGAGFLLISDVSGWEQIYYHGADGALKKQLTPGGWRVNSIARIDEKNGWVYFIGRPAKSWDAQLMRVRLDGTGLSEVSKGEGVHRVQVSPSGAYFIDTVSTLTTPSVMSLYKTDGTLVRKLGDAASPAMHELALGKAELFTIPSEDGQFQLPAYWILPADFNPSKQYPVIFAIYGGPDAGRVHNTWPAWSAQYWAERGVITISVDHRASGHFGKKGVALMHRNLGKWEMTDLITATKWLRSKPFVAKDKIAITGGSYGGYTTAMALTYGAEFFNYGIAASSVTDWRLYDTVYTERYMDTPAENPEGYKQGAVLTYADRYKGGLRLTHGTIDDNVHEQNTLQVVDWLTSHNQRFELMVYPDSRHAIQASQRAHVARETHDYWVRTLLDGKLPEAPAQTTTDKTTKEKTTKDEKKKAGAPVAALR